MSRDWRLGPWLAGHNNSYGLARWRVFLVVVLVLGAASFGALSQWSDAFHACTVDTELDSAGKVVKETTKCGPPAAAAYVFVMGVVLLLLAPAVSEVTIAGIGSAKFDKAVSEKVEQTLPTAILELRVGEDLLRRLSDPSAPAEARAFPLAETVESKSTADERGTAAHQQRGSRK